MLHACKASVCGNQTHSYQVQSCSDAAHYTQPQRRHACSARAVPCPGCSTGNRSTDGSRWQPLPPKPAPAARLSIQAASPLLYFRFMRTMERVASVLLPDPGRQAVPAPSAAGRGGGGGLGARSGRRGLVSTSSLPHADRASEPPANRHSSPCCSRTPGTPAAAAHLRLGAFLSLPCARPLLQQSWLPLGRAGTRGTC